jgi:hypothetical protein
VACCWLLVAVLLAGAAVAWTVRVPTYVAASGVVAAPGDRARGERTRVALVFAPIGAGVVRVGETVRVQIDSSETPVAGAVASVGADVVGPEALSIRHRLRAAGVLPSEPSRPVRVRLAAALPTRSYAGTRVTARIDVGSRRLLALLPGLGKLLAG